MDWNTWERTTALPRGGAALLTMSFTKVEIPTLGDTIPIMIAMGEATIPITIDMEEALAVMADVAILGAAMVVVVVPMVIIRTC